MTVNCPVCGAINDDSSAFCIFCGAPLAPAPMTAYGQAPLAPAPTEVWAPPMPTGEPVPLPPPTGFPVTPQVEGVCPACGFINEPATTFCIICGNPLKEGVVGEAIAAPAPQPTIPYEPVPQGVLCEECGLLNEPGSMFCVQCGQPIAAMTPEPPSPTPQGFDTVVAPVASGRVCPQCGTVNEEGFQFCVGCGNYLDAQTPPVVNPYQAPVEPLGLDDPGTPIWVEEPPTDPVTLTLDSASYDVEEKTPAHAYVPANSAPEVAARNSSSSHGAHAATPPVVVDTAPSATAQTLVMVNEDGFEFTPFAEGECRFNATVNLLVNDTLIAKGGWVNLQPGDVVVMSGSTFHVKAK